VVRQLELLLLLMLLQMMMMMLLLLLLELLELLKLQRILHSRLSICHRAHRDLIVSLKEVRG